MIKTMCQSNFWRCTAAGFDEFCVNVPRVRVSGLVSVRKLKHSHCMRFPEELYIK